MNKKLIIALILILAVVFAFVACKNSGDEGNESTDADTTVAEITTDEDGFADFGSEDETTSGNATGGKHPNNNANNNNNGGNGNGLNITPGDGDGPGFEDIEDNGNSGNGGGDIVIGDNNGKEDSIDWNELG